MFARNTMKYPVLVMGLIMFGIFLSQESTQKWWTKQMSRYKPSTCLAVKDRVAKKAPSSWSMECENTSFLRLTIDFNKELKNPKDIRIVMYRELANIYAQFANNANIPLKYVEDNKVKVYNEIETLEHLQVIQIIMKSKKLEIISQSEGQAVAKFIGLKRKSDIAEHLKLTVKVSEKKI
jgi:hypothetical protein